MVLEHAQGSVADVVNHSFCGIIKPGNVCNRVDDHDILVSHILFHGSSAAGQGRGHNFRYAKWQGLHGRGSHPGILPSPDGNDGIK